MSKGKYWRLGGFAAALAASAGLVAAASGATGAYFNDTKTGQYTGTIGSILVKTSQSAGTGADNLNFNFANLLPGTPQPATVKFQNNGANAEDVYIVFPNVQALHAVNNMGRYGQVTVTSSLRGTVFQSTNLNDGYAAEETNTGALSTFPAQGPGHCPTNPTPPAAGTETPAAALANTSPCWPLPNVIKIASNLGPTQSGTMTFTFGLSAKWRDTATEGQTAFCWPLIQISGDTNPADQMCDVNAPSGVAKGTNLPYQIVATQVGVAPNDPLNSNPTP